MQLRTIYHHNRILITGGVGFIGRHLMASLLHQGISVIAVIRANRTQSALNRAIQVMQPLVTHIDDLNRLTVVEGDVCNTAWVESLSEFGPIDAVIHAASNLSFAPKDKTRVIQSNIEGTQILLDVSTRLNSRTFYYLSTAYVSGVKTGDIPEALNLDPPLFRNGYEESKFLTEQLVSDWAQVPGRYAAILRPSIVVSPRKSDCRFGYYAFAGLFYAMRDAILKSGGKVWINADPNSRLNLISIDDVIEFLKHLLRSVSDGNRQGCEVFHITNPFPPRLGDLTDAPLQWLGLHHKVIFSLVEPPTVDIKIGDKVNQRLGAFYPYLKDFSEFDRSNSDSIYRATSVIDDVFLRGALQSYIPPESKMSRACASLAVRLAIYGVRWILRPSRIDDMDRLYSKEAAGYRIKHHLTTAFNDQRVRNQAADWVARALNGRPGKVLDLATGTGLTVNALGAALGSATTVVGIDRNQDMINAGKRLNPTLHLTIGDAAAFVRNGDRDADDGYTVAPNSLDAITVVFGLGGIKQSQRCAEQILRALKPGGIVVISDIYSPSLSLNQCRWGGWTSVDLVATAWSTITLPMVLKELWGWDDPTPRFFELIHTQYVDSENATFKFEITSQRRDTMRWWLGLPVMPVMELVLTKVTR